MNSILSTAKPKAASRLSKASIWDSQVYLVIYAAIAFANFLIPAVAEIHLPDGDSLDLDSFGKVNGKSTSTYGNMIIFNGNISSLVVAAYILMIILLIVGVVIGAVRLNLRYKYICLLASLNLWVLSLINLKLIDSITVQASVVNSVKLDVWWSIPIPLANLVLIVNIVRTIIQLKKFQKMQGSHDGN